GCRCHTPLISSGASSVTKSARSNPDERSRWQWATIEVPEAAYPGLLDIADVVRSQPRYHAGGRTNVGLPPRTAIVSPWSASHAAKLLVSDFLTPAVMTIAFLIRGQR